MTKARAAGYAMGDSDERRVEIGSADQRWSRSSDPMIVQRFAATAQKASNKFALVRSKMSKFRARNLPVPVGPRRTVKQSTTKPLLLGWTNWWGGGEAA